MIFIITLVLMIPKAAFAETGNDAAFFQEEEVYSGEVSDYLREQLISRNSPITIQIRSDSELDERVFTDCFDSSIEHLGSGYDGDYLRFQMGSWNYEAIKQVDDDGSCLTTVTYTIDYYTTAEQERMVDQRIAEIHDELKLDELSDFECIREIYKYITENVSYDYDNLNNEDYTLKYTAYAALFDGKAVCQGYAALFYRLANECTCYSRIISGTAGESGEAHAWNIVEIDNTYYNLDCTWDAGKGSGRFEYFLKCDASFSDHHRDAEYADADFYDSYPMASEDYLLNPDFDDPTEYTSGYYKYRLDGAGKALITGYSGKEKHIVVPAALDGHPVYAIGEEVFGSDCTAESITLSEGICGWYNDGSSAFYRCPNLITVNLPSTVGVRDGSSYDIIAKNNRFYRCEKLKNINIAADNPYLTVVNNVLFTKDMETLIYYPTGATATVYTVPDTVKYIDDSSFGDQQHLESVHLPSGIESIGWFSFQNSYRLKNINIPDSCTFIGEWAFCDTAIETIHIPANVEEIVAPAFGSVFLETITVSEDNPYYYTSDGVLFSKKTYDDVEFITLECYPGKRSAASYEIPEGVTDIGMNSFYENEFLTRVKIPVSVKLIETCALSGCYNLKQIDYAGTEEEWDAIDIWEGNEDLTKIYKGEYDITDADVTLSGSKVLYNGKVRKPEILSIKELELYEDIDYSISWPDGSPKDAGTYSAAITGMGHYRGVTHFTYTIEKAENPLSASGRKAVVKFKKLKKRAQTVAVSKVIAFRKASGGTLSFRKVSGNKKITINQKTGKVTVKKGMKKGSYKVKVKVSDAGNNNYEPSEWKTVAFSIIIK